MILPILYRSWAKLRLAQLSGCIETWTPGEVYAGVRGRSGEDAWQSAALACESALVDQDRLSMTAVDVFMTNYPDPSYMH
eukprot:2091014-Alexandrium_andersonii.AAC.1